MNNIREYKIIINGVEQSAKAVDTLLQKLDALDSRITKLQKMNVNLDAAINKSSSRSSSSSGSKYDAAKSEAATQKEITDQIALQNAENQKALQLLVQKKQETKEQVKIQQQIAQGVRDTNGEYANTLNGQRALLSEMKKQIGNMDIDDAATREYAEQINQVTEKIKEMEEAYGTFTRNVGNYKSAAEGFQGFNITIGETVRNFGSLREAARTIKNEMIGIDTSTEEGRAKFEEYEQALHDVSIAQDQMSDAAERAATSAKGLHDVLEMMEGLTAVAGIGQGISSLFGLDDTGLGEQITKLQSLMMILQSIKTLQDQMERGVGGGGWIAKLWKGLDNPIASLKKLSAGLKGVNSDIRATGSAGEAGAAGMTLFSAATTAATSAVKAFAKATIILAVLQAIGEAIEWVVDGFKSLIKYLSNPDYKEQERAMSNIETSANAAADALSAYNEEISRRVEAGLISQVEASIKMLEKFDEELTNNANKLKDWFNAQEEEVRDGAVGLSISKTSDDAIDNMNRVVDALKQMDSSTEEYDNRMVDFGKNIAMEMSQMADAGGEELSRFINALNSSEFGQTAMQKFMDSLPEESRASFQNVLDNFYSMADQMANRAAQLHNEIMSSLENIDKQYDRMFNPEKVISDTYDAMRKTNAEALRLGKITQQVYEERNAKIDKMYDRDLQNEKQHQANKTATVKSGGRARVKATQSAGRARISAAKNMANELDAVEKRIQNDKIAIMRDGLGKTLAQLDLEKRNRIEQAEKLRELGEKGEEAYNREILSITELYAKKEFDAKKEWADKWNDYQKQLNSEQEQRTRDLQQRTISRDSMANENWLDSKNMKTEEIAIENLVRRIRRSDADIQKAIKESGLQELLDKYVVEPTEDAWKKILEISEKYRLGINTLIDDEGKEIYTASGFFNEKEYLKSLKRINEIKARMLEITSHLGAGADFDAIEKEYRALEAEQKKLYEGLDISKMPLSNPEELLSKWQTYYDMMYRNQKQYAEKVRDLQLNEIESNRKNDIYDTDEDYSKNLKDIEEKYKQHYQDIEDEYNMHIQDMADKHGTESQEYLQAVSERDQKLLELDNDKNSQIKRLTELHNETIKRIEETANEERMKTQNNFIRESQTATANYYSGLLNELQVFQNKFQQKVEKLPDKSKNAWGIVDLTKYSKGINEFKTQFQKMVKNIEAEQMKLIIRLANNEISLGDFNTAFNELEALKEEANETIDSLTNMGINKIGEFIESINTYIQAVGQGLTEILQTVWDAQSASFDAQQEALEKANSELEKQLSKQEQITQRHADKINQIEDELSTARGDRRQHLIDSLSAQIAAQRASLAAEQRIQKQKEANEKKQDALDKKRKEAQRKQDITSAIISTALATANGLATKPFVPVGIAMGALAAALGAAQVAIISSKHYAKGGVLDGGVAEGPRHSQGGIKVLGGRAEIEGGEFITNRRTTKENAGVLDFINSKKRKLNLDDFVEYYSKAGRNSVIGTRSKFADGGQLPELNDEIDVTSQLQTVIVNQDHRPIWVSVKDINDAQARVRNVQTLAGLK